jgi:uncharacterized protein YndB with AHSA1/START domain
MTKSIQHSYFFPHKPEIVWDYLTKPELIEQWLMKSDFLPVVGYDFQFRTRPLPNFGFDGIIYCKVLEVQPYKRLSYSWKGGPGEGKISLDSVVVWTLLEKDEGTELHLDHSGFKETDINMYAAMHGGWIQNITKIADLINAAKHGKANT